MQKLLECYSFQLDRLALDASGVFTGRSTGDSPFWLLDKLELDKQYFHVRLKVLPKNDDPGV